MTNSDPKIEKSNSGDQFDLEYLCTDEDAWYSIRVFLHGDKLTVNFQNFPEISFNAGDFTTLEEVEEFGQRFRPVSDPLQDNECYRIVEGMRVCACLNMREDDLRYYDALVEAVEYNDHLFDKPEEECLCTFVVSWLHGPNEGNLSPAGVANICILNTDAPLSSMVTSFLSLAKEKTERGLQKSSSVSKSCAPGQTLPAVKRTSISHREIEETRHVRQFPGMVKTYGGLPRLEVYTDSHIVLNHVVSCCHNNEDRDLGGVDFEINNIEESGNHHYVLIDNLEKDLSPATIMEFIHKQTSVLAQACVFPCLLAESYIRGAILLDSKRKVEQICDFLTNPDHIIISSTGRPWVITEKTPRSGNLSTVGKSVPKSQSDIGDKLKVVRIGSEEYRKATGLRDLFMDFINHQRLLHEKLAVKHNESCFSLAS